MFSKSKSNHKLIFKLQLCFFFLEYVIRSTEDDSYIDAQTGYNPRVKSEILQKLRAIE